MSERSWKTKNHKNQSVDSLSNANQSKKNIGNVYNLSVEDQLWTSNMQMIGEDNKIMDIGENQ